MGKRGPKSANSVNYSPKTDNSPPKPPAGMNTRARRIWKNLVASYSHDHFTESDYPLLRAYCEAEELHFKASLAIGKEGAVIEKTTVVKNPATGEKELMVSGVKTSPWVAIQTQTAHTMAQLATKLRMATNSRVAPDEVDSRMRKHSKRAGLLFGEEEWPLN